MNDSSFSKPGGVVPSRRLVSRLVTTAAVLLALAVNFTAAAQTAPKVISVTPTNGTTLVATTTDLVFVFDQDMDTTVSVIPSAQGFTGNLDVTAPAIQSVYGSWSDDSRTLTVSPAIQYPLGTINWSLNPAASFAFFRFKSKAGVEVANVSGSFSTGVGGSDPHLGSSVPANGALAVSIAVQVEFKFDTPMKKDPAIAGAPPGVPAAVAWTGTGVDPAKFTYSWSADGRSLYCTYATNLPKNTLITWLLNPAAAPVKLQSQTSKLLAADTYTGTFKTGTANPNCDASGLPAGYGSHNVTKSGNYVQTSTADPLPATDEGSFAFSASVNAPASAPTLTAGSITRPDTTQNSLLVFGSFGSYFESPATEAALDTTYPAGAYTLRFTLSGQAEHVIPMTMPANPPPVPKIINFNEAQAVNAAADFTLHWNGLTGAGPNDHQSIYISDTNGNIFFQAPDLCVPIALPVTATSIVIPANTLPTNATLNASLIYGRVFHRTSNSIPDMVGFGDLIRRTTFDMKTGTGGGTTPAAPAALGNAGLSPGGNPEFQLTGTPTRLYTIQRAASADATSWPDVGTVTLDAGGHGAYEDTSQGKVYPLFYRAVAK